METFGPVKVHVTARLDVRQNLGQPFVHWAVHFSQPPDDLSTYLKQRNENNQASAANRKQYGGYSRTLTVANAVGRKLPATIPLIIRKTGCGDHDDGREYHNP